MSTHKILFLAADPVGFPERRLDEQARQIQEEIQLAQRRDQFEFIPCMAARPMDLLRALRRIRPSVVQFSGNRGVDEIYLVQEDRRPAQVTLEALRVTFEAAGQSVQILVLNGCKVSGTAEALCDVVPVCVGTSPAIGDDAARAFSIGFYGALASGESAALACSQGGAAMALQVIGQHDRPSLHHRHDVDPRMFCLADSVASMAYLARFDKSTLQKTIARYTVALRADPADRDALLAIGVCYLTLGLFDAADRSIRQMMDAHPADPAGYYYRAICVLGGRRPRTASLPVIRKAEQLILAALELDPSNGCYDALLAAIRHDYYVLNGMRVPAPTPEQLAASAERKRVNRIEVEQIFHLIKVNDGTVRRRLLS